MNTATECTYLIKAKAKQLGFLDCGISKAEKLSEEESRLKDWLKNGMHGKMHYMENHFDKRLDPTKLVEGAKSIISLTYNYYTEKYQLDPNAPRISKYAYGKDYHLVIKKKLQTLYNYIEEITGRKIVGRSFVDSAPIMERAWATRSGLGWIGKNSLLLNKKNGSYFFLAEIICDLELKYDKSTTDHCGTCTKCIDACPTDAITQPYVVDGSKCISYFTIELKADEAIPEETKGKLNNWAFGCDICQDICPWNSHAIHHNESEFEPTSQLLNMKKEEWENMTQFEFDELFKDSPVQRTGYNGLVRNIKAIKD